ncbi:MAG TPA: LacI family DNA-binding transcriptional regulator [Xanthomonadales bacterium]|nr:LacI family DNA-binding transcriptional regulator [Xanthomonadales bacterium]
MTTIYQVSEAAGVSLATVSRVLNNSDKVKPKTREKVLETMKELGYRPNFIAQSLASNRSNSVGILIPELYGPFFGVMLANIEEELRNSGKHVIITAGHSDTEREEENIEFLLTRQCDALILHVYSVSDEYLLKLNEGSVPIILLNRYVEGMASQCISLDNEYGGYLAAKALLDAGHRSIAYISGPVWKVDSYQRLTGHKRALAEYDLKFDEALLYEGDFEEGSGRYGMNHLLDKDIPFTAVACANDEMAAGALDAARSRGLTLPEDLSLIGFDNVFLTRYTHPKLSSIDCDLDEMGRMAARLVLRDEYGREEIEITNNFEPSVVMRDSIARVNGAG